MKFLCLCGAYGSSDKFRVQLAPLIKELASDETAELFFAHGPVDAFPPEGYEDYFGPGPHYRFIKPGNAEEGGSDLLDRIRNFPKGATAEDQMRELMRIGVGSAAPVPNANGIHCDESAQDAMEYLYDIMQEEGPFDGIIGYSEGATVAGTLLLHEQKRFEIEGRLPMFKCAVFFAGWPPLTPEFDGIVLADTTDLTITIPTLHIIGSLDPYLAGCISLYNVCDMDNAYLFDHGKGHTLPRDPETVRELGNIIRTMGSSIGLL
ncbi:b34df6cb-47cc-4eed-8c17-f661ba13acdb [Sclerotinia trifoliorum]|uniref:B34df6cb-47cc-4eed-8c17-f661ba13acdb n=1 Tax=Sclerotinia trifoliorum TaxID=28548 RepID=A0A8H2ZR72_9HELO|nr:b34df6cb-47cc-4eed-8c17-f661ba13acdb [Sclerotinia trifoliorum]